MKYLIKKILNGGKTFFKLLIDFFNSPLAMSLTYFGILAFALKSYSKSPNEDNINTVISFGFLCLLSTISLIFNEVKETQKRILLETELLIRKIKNESKTE